MLMEVRRGRLTRCSPKAAARRERWSTGLCARHQLVGFAAEPTSDSDTSLYMWTAHDGAAFAAEVTVPFSSSDVGRRCAVRLDPINGELALYTAALSEGLHVVIVRVDSERGHIIFRCAN
jgi:hypothetical protein